jgi:hypothetical protein
MPHLLLPVTPAHCILKAHADACTAYFDNTKLPCRPLLGLMLWRARSAHLLHTPKALPAAREARFCACASHGSCNLVGTTHCAAESIVCAALLRCVDTRSDSPQTHVCCMLKASSHCAHATFFEEN